MKDEDRFASTGIKFWQHRNQMGSYKTGDGCTAISTHIAPEGTCNLCCTYCSVRNRDCSHRLPMWIIEDYVDKLMSRGLKAVILTGGGEPTLYPRFNTLVRALCQRGLKIGLITNGTLGPLVDRDVWQAFAWVRVSINQSQNETKPINVSSDLLSTEAVFGLSMVVELHEGDDLVESDALHSGWLENMEDAQGHADRLGARYVRVLPDCMPEGSRLRDRYRVLADLVDGLDDQRFFVHQREHRAPNCTTCHQSFFRPYLSEQPFAKTGEPGSVYPCDALVLNAGRAQFDERYQLCAPGDILEYLDHRLPHEFNPMVDCQECLFADSVEMLGRWERGDIAYRMIGPIDHEEFV